MMTRFLLFHQTQDTTNGPRLRDKAAAAEYLSVSIDTVERLINTGKLPIVRLPVENRRESGTSAGVSKRVLIDVCDLDRIIDESKETRGLA
jgi:hypothetical protein